MNVIYKFTNLKQITF